jgi:hypothetical protein
MEQMGFFDLSDRYASLDAKKDPLLEIYAAVPWEEFRHTLEQIWRKPDTDRKSRAGRKPIDAVLMFKTLVLSALYNLSDDQIEYEIRDRLSFMSHPAVDCKAVNEYPYWSSRLFIPFSTVAQQCICHDNELAHDCCNGQFFALPS